MAAAPQEPVTFSNQVVRIFQDKCQTCHHPGDIAPFSLMTYEESVEYADQIAERTASHQMPPWKPVEGCSEFLNKRSLSDDEIETIGRWVADGAPEGDPADMPASLTFPDEWKLGEPDVELVSTRQGYKVPASASSDIYRCFTVATNFDTDRFITGVEVRPGNHKIVHHILLFIDTSGVSVDLDRADPGPGYTSFGGPGFNTIGSLGGWAPGAPPTELREGTGYLVPRGARVVMQIHYKPNGEDEVDQTRIGLHFARSPVYQDAIVLPLINRNFTIPAGARDYPVNVSFSLPPGVNLTLESVAPHMHLLGREMQVTATLPGGERRCLIYINDWDFHWQGAYRYADRIPLPGGTQIDVQALYDNSELNHSQPNFPPQDVSWGERTTDEMCIAFLGITVDAEHRTPSEPALDGAEVKGSRLVVSGQDIRNGSIIEVNGAPLRDSRTKSRHSCSSRADWLEAIPEGTTVNVTVLNPDGARSQPIVFSR